MAAGKVGSLRPPLHGAEGIVTLMVRLTRLNGTEVTVNADLIETIEAMPDTVIALVTQRKIVVRESPDAIVDLTIAYHRRSGGVSVRPPLVALHDVHAHQEPEDDSRRQREQE